MMMPIVRRRYKSSFDIDPATANRVTPHQIVATTIANTVATMVAITVATSLSALLALVSFTFNQIT